ncbi:glycosyltransferase family 2 protein [Paracoccus pacificus]|uniref:Glycosyltransferase family 2 protein n=1 Tax=Paracoccus pacificus TaxID=1463598 RepID=A0ABW4R786_9RHOB
MTETGPSWGVVALVDEPAALTAAFVAHHLVQGASEVHVCLDRPDAETQDLLAGVGDVRVWIAGQDGWADSWQNQRPLRHQGRQKYMATHAYQASRADWMLHCDADEFLHQVRPLRTDLAHSDPNKHWRRLLVHERVFLSRETPAHIFSGQFRSDWKDRGDAAFEIYGFGARYLNRGLTGHVAGKAITRTGHPYALGVHFPLRDYHVTVNDIPYAPSKSVFLMHFDGLTPLHYALKMLRREMTVVKGPQVAYGDYRRAQYSDMAAAAGDPNAVRDMHWLCQGLSHRQVRALSRKKLLHDDAPDIPGAVRQVFGDKVDLSPAAFDRALIRREPELIARARDRYGFDAEAVSSATG